MGVRHGLNAFHRSSPFIDDVKPPVALCLIRWVTRRLLGALFGRCEYELQILYLPLRKRDGLRLGLVSWAGHDNGYRLVGQKLASPPAAIGLPGQTDMSAGN